MKQTQPKSRQTKAPTTGLVETISQDDFASFLSAPYAIIWAARGASPDTFPFAVTLQLRLFHVPPVRLGVVDLSALDWSPHAKLSVLDKLKDLQLQPDTQGEPPAGYYLFAGGRPIAFHPGRVDFTKDENPLMLGVITGIFGAVAESKELAQLGSHIAKWNAGERVAKAFAEAIRRHSSKRTAGEADAQPPPVDESVDQVLRRAYAALNLSPSASNEEVIAAHRRLVRECHPDRFAGNPIEQERATRRTAELNAARDFILGRRREPPRVG